MGGKSSDRQDVGNIINEKRYYELGIINDKILISRDVVVIKSSLSTHIDHLIQTITVGVKDSVYHGLGRWNS